MNQRPSRKGQIARQASPQPALEPAEGARQLLRELNVQGIPIQPREIAEQLQIVVWEREMESPYDGCLMRVGDAWGILLNNLIQSESRKNFTIAHELGHYYLDGGQTEGQISATGEENKAAEFVPQHRCQREDLRGFDSHQLEEQRANQFAVELLMPSPIFRADAADLPKIGLAAIGDLAARYSTSLTSTAIRYTRLSPHVCAIVLSEKGQIKYFAYSDRFRQNSDCYLAKNKPLHPDAVAAQLAKDKSKEVKEHRRKVPLSYWCSTQSDQALVEQSRRLPRMNQVLSFLWLPDTP
jgi:Zn-dependent peptidase ImmA (M78 family)